MKTTRQYVMTNKNKPSGTHTIKQSSSVSRKSIKYFRSMDYLYAAIFFSFIFFSVIRFNYKQKEIEETYNIGTIQSISVSNRAFGEISVKTDKTSFLISRRAGLVEGNEVKILKLVSGKYLICADSEEKCFEIDKNSALTIRPHI
ncbi:hypothetical protein [Xenorhabdus sp. KJ12.1]|uniref:hypothetical protein n=1 Tax=Xenorhabdus sp. KJ12.1 TaxID=1851571 RepID=UPI000C039CD7|nr:hypothetical protein [Xenorhabdus sp. KJ12.1]PHM72333.1 hypothetical protein Xekj_00611 [Xenorhabdus sp. KJ12.1]